MYVNVSPSISHKAMLGSLPRAGGKKRARVGTGNRMITSHVKSMSKVSKVSWTRPDGTIIDLLHFVHSHLNATRNNKGWYIRL